MAYESLIEEAKKYLTFDNSEFEKYYTKATESLEQNYKNAIASLSKQYSKDRNDAAAQAMQNSRNMNQYLAARGLARSGESVQEKINSNLSLNNALSDLADSNSRQIAELAKNKNDSLLSLEEKRLDRKNAIDKWTAEQAFNIAKAENAKIEREEDIAREAQQLEEERAYQDAVRKDKYAHEMAVMEAEQAFKQRTTAEQREYEEYLRNNERELEAQIRAEKAKLEAEKAAIEQQYKLDYYREQQADKERLIAEERAYNETVAKQKAEAASSAGNSASSSKNDSGYSGKTIVQSVTGGKTKLTSTADNVAAYKTLQEISKKGVTPTQLTALENELTLYGYKKPSDREVNQIDVVKNAADIFEKAYKNAETQLAEQNIGKIAARPYALQSAEQAQLSYVRAHTTSTESFYEVCDQLNIDRSKAYRFLQSDK